MMDTYLIYCTNTQSNYYLQIVVAHDEKEARKLAERNYRKDDAISRCEKVTEPRVIYSDNYYY